MRVGEEGEAVLSGSTHAGIIDRLEPSGRGKDGCRVYVLFASLKVCLGYGVARGISSRQSGKHWDRLMERDSELLRGRTALLICSFLSSGGVGNWCDGVLGNARHRLMVSGAVNRWQIYGVGCRR